MSNAKPTPGPWTAKHVSGSNFAVQQFDIRAPFAGNPHIYPIFHRDLSAIDGQSVCVSPADALLISAAPDLLAACKGLLDHACIADAAPEDVDEEDRALERAARKAIAKATGA